ncbi:hypothetical protein ACFLS9_03810 [Bacteroidota bacterium]
MVKDWYNNEIVKEIAVTANRILQENVDISVRVRLLKDVLHRSADYPVLSKAINELSNHERIQFLKK